MEFSHFATTFSGRKRSGHHDAQRRVDDARGEAMKKRAYFDSRQIDGWPSPQEVETHFFPAPGQPWPFADNDGAGFDAHGVDGTGHLERGKGRIDIRLQLWAHPSLGVLLIWSKWGGGHELAWTSKGDLSRLRQFIRTQHADLMPVGLFVPYTVGWKAMKEFLETDGALPKSIEWIANKDLPPRTFPDPTDHRDWRRSSNFARIISAAWPRPEGIERYFLSPPGQRWFFETGTDLAAFEAHGLEGTDHLDYFSKERVDVRFEMWGHSTSGVLLTWWKKGGGHDEAYFSKGNLARRRERVWTLDGRALPACLFLPYETAWKAVKEFLEKDGALPTSIEWIARRDMPPGILS
jgi:hypothetical protein